MSAMGNGVLSGRRSKPMMNENDLQRERAETVAAIRRAMEQAARGEAISLEEAETLLRKKHGFFEHAPGVADS